MSHLTRTPLSRSKGQMGRGHIVSACGTAYYVNSVCRFYRVRMREALFQTLCRPHVLSCRPIVRATAYKATKLICDILCHVCALCVCLWVSVLPQKHRLYTAAPMYNERSVFCKLIRFTCCPYRPNCFRQCYFDCHPEH